jgi:Sulfatase-modifying factor enzyme 1
MNLRSYPPPTPAATNTSAPARGIALPLSNLNSEFCNGKFSHLLNCAAAITPMLSISAMAGVSRFGLHHMTGNVWNWSRDFYSPDAYAAHRDPDPQHVTPTPFRSERGGSWVGPSRIAIPAYRRGRPPVAPGRCLGFRCMGAVPAE